MSKDLGCFGMPSVYNSRSETCSACESKGLCAETAYKVLSVLRSKGIPVESKLGSFEIQYAAPDAPRVVALTGAQKAAISGAPAKLAKRLEKLFLSSFDKIAMFRFRNGINPFPETGAKHLHLAGNLLLQGGFTINEFKDRCCRDFNWNPNTASVEVSQAMALLRILGLTTERGQVTVLANG